MILRTVKAVSQIFSDFFLNVKLAHKLKFFLDKCLHCLSIFYQQRVRHCRLLNYGSGKKTSFDLLLTIRLFFLVSFKRNANSNKTFISNIILVQTRITLMFEIWKLFVIVFFRHCDASKFIISQKVCLDPIIHKRKFIIGCCSQC